MADDESILGTGVTTRQVEAFGRKVSATANHLIGDPTHGAYQQAMNNIHRGMQRPGLQQSVFSLTRASPRETIRAKLSTNEIQHRALSYIPDDLLTNLPADQDNTFSLFQGFKATLPEDSDENEEEEQGNRRKMRRSGRQQRLLKATEEEDEAAGAAASGTAKVRRARREQGRANHKLEMLGIRKSMCSAEILEIDKKVANLQSMRKIVLERLADLEDEELKLEQDIAELDIKVDEMQELADEEEASAKAKAAAEAQRAGTDGSATPGVVTPATTEGGSTNDGFMSASIYSKLPGSTPGSGTDEATPSKTAAPRRQKLRKRKSMPIRHGHFTPGTSLRSVPAHNDMITSLDFDAPFGTMVTAALDDTLRVWDLNSGRCLGLLEGHRASVRCLQVEDSLVATGSIDASIRLWDMSRIDAPVSSRPNNLSKPQGGDSGDGNEEEQGEEENDEDDGEYIPTANATADCEIFSLEAHVAEITALHFRGDTLVSGSSDKTLRQWDLVKGRCVQTLDVLWAAAQASSSPAAANRSSGNMPTAGASNSSAAFLNQPWRTTSRLPDANADFVGALQCFDAALACGTADGMVRLWDLRSGQVSRSLVGHTGPVSCLQFDDMHLVTGSLDRSIRVWDLRTGSIFDAFAFENPVTSMMFDARRIVAAAGESVIKVYDKADGNQWDCGEPEEDGLKTSIVEKVRIKDGFLVEGRRDGTVGVWTC